MEHGGNVIVEPPLEEQLPEVFQVEMAEVPQLSFFERNADVVVTFMGYTGPLKTVKEACPVLKEDPTRGTSDALDRFGAKVMLFSGHEIPEADRHLLEPPKPRQEAPRHERNERDAAEKQEKTPEPKQEHRDRPERERQNNVEPVVGTRDQTHQTLLRHEDAITPPVAPLIEVSPPVLPEIIARAVHESASIEHTEDRVAPTIADAKVTPSPTIAPRAVEVDPLLFATEPSIAEVLRTNLLEELYPKSEAGAEIDEGLAEAALPEPQIPSAEQLTIATETAEAPSAFGDILESYVLPAAETSVFAESFGVPDMSAVPEVQQHELDPVEQQHAWMVEIATTDPDILYEEFTEALNSLVEMTPEVGVDVTVPQEADQVQQQEQQSAAEPVPAVCLEVVEALRTIEPEQKELAVASVQSIAETVQEIRVLQISHEGSEEIAAAQERLVKLVTELFTYLDIEADEEKIAQFIHVLLRPDFMAAPEPAEVLDLEHMGTHEVKRHFIHVGMPLTDILNLMPLQQTLGLFALFRAMPELRTTVFA